MDLNMPNSPTANSPVSVQILPDSVSGTARRIASVDIFRGLVMLVMIFVNDVGEVRGLPPWTYHMKANVDAMTYVDMVFPAFLFAIGLSMPLAIQSRLAKVPSLPSLWWHIVQRSISLMVLGLVLANADKFAPTVAPLHISAGHWALLALFGAVLLLVVLPKQTEARWRIASRTGGAVLLLGALLVFRRVDAAGAVRWLDFSYWEILGIIGWTYFATCVLYVPLRRHRLAPVLWLIAMVAFNMLSAAHILQWPNQLPLYVWPWSNGAFVVMTLAGLVTAQITLTSDAATGTGRKLAYCAGFAAVLIVAAVVSTPLGISKIRATPTWCLGSAGACVLIFAGLYWVCDVKRKTSWSAFVRPAGANTLLTYLLPDFFAFGVSLAWLPAMWKFGLPGAFRAMVFTALILTVAYWLTRWRIRLQL